MSSEHNQHLSKEKQQQHQQQYRHQQVVTRSSGGASKTATRTNQIGSSSGGVIGGGGRRWLCRKVSGGGGKLLAARAKQTGASSTLVGHTTGIESGDSNTNGANLAIGGKRRRASIIANASSSFVDKLTYMIKKSNTLTRSEGDFGDLGQKAAVTTTLSRTATRSHLLVSTGSKQHQRTISPNSTDQNNSKNNNTNTNTKYLISELSWRQLVRRCRKVQFSGAIGKGSSQKQHVALETDPASSSSMATSSTKTSQSAAQEQQRQQQQVALALATEAADASNLQASSHINSSISTLSTAATPTGCCFCDELSSSGFVSSLSGGVTSTCSDSNTTHSCSSSTYNEQQPTATTTNAANLTPTTNTISREGKQTGSKQPPGEGGAALAGAMQQQQPFRPEEPLCVGQGAKGGGSRGGQQAHCQEPAGGEGGEGGAKKKSSGGSFLSRARNSTINLASLATVTNVAFNCSASVGNLWSWQAAQRRELADLETTEGTIKPIEYQPSAQFDHYDTMATTTAPIGDPNNNHFADRQKQQVVEESACKAQMLSQLNNSNETASQRKGSSTKEKKRRQKEAEKVEKLRMLVSYLKSGTSQPLLRPVALEADELELAQRYKLHLILCEDCLQATEAAVSSSTPSSATLGLPPLSAGNSGHHRSGSRTPDSQHGGGGSTTIAGIVINVRRSSDQPSLPAPHLGSAASSPSIDTASAGLDGGPLLQLQLEQQHSSAFAIGATGSTTGDNSTSTGYLSPGSQQANQQQLQQQLLCYKCNKPTGRNRSSIMSSVDLTATASQASDIDSTLSTSENNAIQANQHQQNPFEPKLCKHHHYHHNHHHHHHDHNHHHNNIGADDRDDHHQQFSRQESPQMSESQHEDDCDSRGFLSSCRSMPSRGRTDGMTTGGSSSAARGSARRHHQSSSHPLIGNTSWLLRHSISDPGSSQLGVNGFRLGRQGPGSSFSSSSGAGGGGAGSASNNNGSIKLKPGQGPNNLNQTSHKLFYIDDLERKDSDSSDTNSQSAAATALNAAQTNRNHQQELLDQRAARQQRASKGTISSSEAIRDLPTRSWSSELFISSTPTKTSTTTITNNTTRATATPTPTPTTSITSNNVALGSSQMNANQLVGVEAVNAITTPTSTRAETSNQTANGSSPANSNRSNDCDNNAKTKTSAWTNPQNLATWIDNEVNSLVHDLEAKSQLVVDEKPAKSSKRKWLSSSSRRNSSGAHST